MDKKSHTFLRAHFWTMLIQPFLDYPSGPQLWKNRIKNLNIYLHFKQSEMLFFWINHCFWQHCFNHFVNVIVWFEQIGSRNTITVYLVILRIVHFGSLRPVKTHIAGSLMTELKRTFGFFLWHSSKNQKCFLSLPQILGIFVDIRFWNINLTWVVNTYNWSKIREKFEFYLLFLKFWSSMM